MSGELLNSSQARELGLLQAERSSPLNRVKRYGLEELCWELHLQGYTTYKITQACNNKLMERIKSGDQSKYIEIAQTTVEQFLRNSKHELETTATESSSNNLAVSKARENIMGRLTNSMVILETELDKLRNIDGPISEVRQEFFIKLMKEIRSFLELAANIEGQLQPSVSINVFTQNLNKLCDKIEAEKSLDSNAKRVILNMVADTVVTSDLLGGPVIDVPSKVITEEPNASGTGGAANPSGS